LPSNQSQFMNLLFRPALLLTCLLLLGIPASRAEAAGPLLEDIVFTSVSPQEEHIAFQLNGPHLPKIFTIKDGPPRVVFDFAQVGYKMGRPRSIETKGHFVKSIRVGSHGAPAPKTRVVLDLVTATSLDVKHQFDEKTNTLRISILHAGSPATAPALSPDQTSAAPTAARPAKPETTPSLPASSSPAKTPNPLDAAQPADSPPWHTFVQPDKKTTPTSTSQESPAVAKKAAPAPDKGKAPVATGEKTATEKAAGKQVAPPTLTDQAPAERTPGSAAPPLLKNISFDPHSSRGEMILFQMNDFYPPIVFGVEQGLPKVVCDFMNTRMGQGVSSLIEAKGRHVERIRTARHQDPDKLRVVIDLAPNHNYDLQQVFFKEDNLFVIIVNLLNENKDKAAGDLPAGHQVSGDR